MHLEVEQWDAKKGLLHNSSIPPKDMSHVAEANIAHGTQVAQR